MEQKKKIPYIRRNFVNNTSISENWEKINQSISGVRTIDESSGKIKWDLCPLSHTRVNSKWIKDLRIKTKTF